MFTRLRVNKFVWVLRVFVITTMIAGFTLPVQGADDDLAKKLVGRWEGGAATRKGGDEFLVIEIVKPEGDQWTGAGRFGNAENKGRPVTIKITTSGSDVTLEFTTPAGVPTTLKLTGDRDMEGTMRARGRQPGSMVNAQAQFKKVD
jgi:hypothetical protein